MRVALLAFLMVVALSCDRPEIDRGQPNPGGADAAVLPDTGLPVGGPCEDRDWPSAQSWQTDERVAVVLGSLTLEEKIAQMAGEMPGAEMFHTPDNERLGVRGFRFRDGPRGVRLEKGTATCFPVSVARAAAWDLELEERIGAAMGEETRGLGHNVLLAPTINTLRHPGWGRGQETYGEDPWLLGKIGAAMTRGIQTQVPACVKHYAGNNIEDTRMTNNALIDEQTLRENYTRQFEMVVREADAACIMSAYNKVNGSYCSENAPLLRDILKGEWAFDGFVVSDWLAAQSTIESALGGLDVEMPWRQHYWYLQQAVESGQVREEIIDEAVERILRVKFRYDFAMLDEPFPGDPEVVESPAHIALAREAAVKGMVLLKNEGTTLPLDRRTVGRIAVIGPWADEARLGDRGSSNVVPSYAVTPYAGLAGRAGLEVVTSVDASAAEGADVAVVVVALTQEDEGEAIFGGGDRDSLDLSAEHEALVLAAAERADRVVVVIEAGGPVTMERWKQAADAIVMAWYPGMEGGNALADLLLGEAEFEGRLVQTWPVRVEDAPVFGNRQSETEYAYLHGYRHFDDTGVAPLFPFGYGLSYTSFAYSNLSLPCEVITPRGELVVSFEVENTGTRPGVEVAQLYVAYPETAARRPVKELKGFARVALAAGERRTVEIAVPVPELAYWDVERGEWLVDLAEHEVRVGPHAAEQPLMGRFAVGAEGREVQ